jgi:UDP-2,3-diacylglucosamine hydrolase
MTSPARYLFVSDLHLDASAPEAIRQFGDFLAGSALHAEALYILGDLFETWVGDDDTEAARNEVCNRLLEYTQAGHACFVMHGNRDFLLGPGFERRTGCRLLGDPVLLEKDSLRALVTHGDLLCTADHAYQGLRSIVRDARWQKRFLSLPLDTRRAMADAARAGSRAHTGRMQSDIMDVDAGAVIEAFRAAGCQLMIHGHTHRPAVHTHQVDGHPARRIVLGDWYEQGSYLDLHADGSYELACLRRARA